jgi:hypothetical protein
MYIYMHTYIYIYINIKGSREGSRGTRLQTTVQSAKHKHTGTSTLVL